MQLQAPDYRLVRRPSAAAVPPRLDNAQQAVAAHHGGPLLVLAGPGTGKTTTIVEAVVDRIERRGIDPRRILVLTFSRKAAHELRERITARLRRTTREPLALTFHSYAYALVRREFIAAGDEPPRLLSGPEQLLEVRQMLRGEAADGALGWPPQLRRALTTRGFAEELRDTLLRAAERGLDGGDLARLGRGCKREEWVAAGMFAQRYAARFDLAPVPAYDYAQIIRIAAAMLTRSAIRARERDAYDVVFVDEYQDTDPAQAELLSSLASGGRELIVVGDPDQSIYGFRGADVRAILTFPDQFPTADGQPAPVIALRESRRSGPALLAASRRVAARLPALRADSVGSRHRDLKPPDAKLPGEVAILVAESASQEAAVVADALRRAHLADGVPWSRMAILVRSARLQVPLLRRALTAAGVPVTVAGDELPLVSERAIRPLLLSLRCALKPQTLDGEAAAELLTGPLGEMDALGLRRLRRALRASVGDVETGGDLDGMLAAALADPRELILVPGEVRAPAERVAGVLAAARQAVADGGSAEDVLWAVWDSSGLAARWQADSATGGARGAAADRNLDAVLALFDAAVRHAERLPPGVPGLFLESLTGQEIPGDTLAEQAAAGNAVRVLTAHRAKGLEWDVVVVAGVQEGSWPDLRTRGSLLGVDELVEVAAGAELPSRAAAVSTMYKLLGEERRLFYVAITRARHRLLVTAVGGDDAQERPSRFLRDLAGDTIPIQRVAGAQARWLSLPALVASLRGVACDVTKPQRLRAAAAARLAKLAKAGVRGAHPQQWYALTPLSGMASVTRDAATVRLSPSHVESFTKCGLRWLLEVAAGARSGDVARGLGTVIHAAAAAAAAGAGDAEIEQQIDEAWRHLDFGSVWYSEKRREEAQRMVRRFLDWHRENPRKLAAVEEPFRIQLGGVEITGRVDRLEVDEDGRAVIVDLKTGTSKPADDELDRHPQLGVYQLAVLLGAFERFGLIEPGGAELVQVGRAALTATARVQRQREPAADPEPDWAQVLVEAVAEGMAGPAFKATVNPGCRTCPVASCCPAHERGGQVGP